MQSAGRLLTAIASVVLAVVPLAGAAGPREGQVPRIASMETRGLGFESVDSTPGVGTVTRQTRRAYDGTHSARAHTPPGRRNRFARGTFDVSWGAGDEVWYGAAFFLPSGFYSRLQGQVEVLRWDNWALAGRTQDQGGVAILPDGRWALVRKSAGVEEQWLVTEPVAPVETGRWHWVEVHQRLAADASAVNELWVDGVRVAASREANWYGRPVTALRMGIVALAATRQRLGLTLFVDRASVSPRRVGRRPGRLGARARRGGGAG